MKRLLKKLIGFFKSIFSSEKNDGEAPKIINAYGGFDFTKAVEDKSAVIGNLKVTTSAMSYTWKSGSLKGWGLSDTSANAIAVFGVKDKKGTYKAGKFEWVSKSRTTRAFTNIKSGYGGWPKDAIETAQGYAFCIVSKDAKHRTNWIFADKLGKSAIELRNH